MSSFLSEPSPRRLCSVSLDIWSLVNVSSERLPQYSNGLFVILGISFVSNTSRLRLFDGKVLDNPLGQPNPETSITAVDCQTWFGKLCIPSTGSNSPANKKSICCALDKSSPLIGSRVGEENTKVTRYLIFFEKTHLAIRFWLFYTVRSHPHSNNCAYLWLLGKRLTRPWPEHPLTRLWSSFFRLYYVFRQQKLLCLTFQELEIPTIKCKNWRFSSISTIKRRTDLMQDTSR